MKIYLKTLPTRLRPGVGVSRLAVIGGSGFETLVNGKNITVRTKFGKATLLQGELGGKPFLFLSRHGPGHDIPPHKINYKANAQALAEQGVTDILSLCAVGSMRKRTLLGKMMRRKGYDVGDIVIVRDLVRLTPGPTFFNSFKDKPMHTDMSEPYSPGLMEKVQEAARRSGVKLMDGAVLTDTSGPRYETKSEVRILASYGIDLAGMTTTSESILANELRTAGYDIRNATLATVTNYGTGLLRGKIDHQTVGAIIKEKEESVKGIVYQLVQII